MRRFYRLILHLYPRLVRKEFANEMLDVFDEAAAAERRAGPVAYARFCAREALGLVINLVAPEASMKHLRLTLYGSLAGLLIGGAIAAALANRPYMSTAFLHVVPPPVPERFVSALNIPVSVTRPSMLPVVLSRGNLSSIINAFNLYPDERRRLPMEDVVELMRSATHVTSPNSDTIEVSFTYPDRFAAQKVTADVVSRIMAEHIRSRVSVAIKTVQFMKDAVAVAGADWEEHLAHLRQAAREGQPIERLKLDTDIARQRYESLSAKLAEAQTAQTLEKYELGASLEVLDPASLPAESRNSIVLIAFAGLSIGGLLGLLMSWILSLRPRAAIPAM